MGATTKTGRTRNRRRIQLSSPLGSYPTLIAAQIAVVTSATVRRGSLRITESVPYGHTTFVGDGPLMMFSSFDSDVIPVTVTWNAGASVWEFTNPLNWVPDEDYFILPWQPQLRGMAGEWFAPIGFACP